MIVRRIKRTIDYFLQTIVFPRHMREFPQKLSASGWDLGGLKTHPTTGFSGTADAQHLLPLSLEQRKDPKNQAEATAANHIGWPTTKIVLLPTASRRACDTMLRQAQISDAELILDTVREQEDPNLRVILDVGAQILELTNSQVASRWLQRAREQDTSIEAAVYVNDDDEIMVMRLTGSTEKLRTSPFADRLDVCIVFLDEAHTRGVDLKLPSHYRAAVILGTGLTRDKLVQGKSISVIGRAHVLTLTTTACMRMRRLGSGGQSLTLFVPPEIQSKICESDAYPVKCSADIKPAHIYKWAWKETAVDLGRNFPIWANQGYRYHDHQALWDQEDLDSMTNEGAARFLEQESLSLEQRYRPRSVNYTERANQELRQDDTNWAKKIRERLGKVNTDFSVGTFQEEQERELAPEAEEQKQIEGPEPAKVAGHGLHRDLRKFVLSGTIVADSDAFVPAFQSLRGTTAADYINLQELPKQILVTRDFANTAESRASTIKARGLFVSDAFQRPVQWILSSQPVSWDVVVVISPFEAQRLLPIIRRSGKTTLHVYAPRPSLDIRPLDDLALYTIPSSPGRRSPLPPHLATQLNLFAGQLYFKNFDEYIRLCNMLRLAWKQPDTGDCIGPDGFLQSAQSKAGMEVIRASTLTQSPVNFLKAFLSKSRRDGQAIGKTHLGKVLDGFQFKKKDLDGDEDVEMSG